MNTVDPIIQESTQSWKDVVSEIGKQLDTHAQQADNSSEFAHQMLLNPGFAGELARHERGFRGLARP